MNIFQAPTLPDISDDKEEWPSLDQNEDAFEAQFQSNDLFRKQATGSCYRHYQDLDVTLPLNSVSCKSKE